MKMTNQEYFELIQRLVNQQYTQEEESLPDSFSGSWIPAESEIKQKMKLKEAGGFCDLTNVKKNKMKDFIVKSGGIRVGQFVAKIIKSEYTDNQMKDLVLDLTLYEEKYKTALGNPAVLLNKIDPIKDYRFSKCQWVIHWNGFQTGKKIPIDTVLDIVRWLQGIRKLTAFI
jgi:hypothetical protein